jgi:hypothetical protein
MTYRNCADGESLSCGCGCLSVCLSVCRNFGHRTLKTQHTINLIKFLKKAAYQYYWLAAAAAAAHVTDVAAITTISPNVRNIVRTVIATINLEAEVSREGTEAVADAKEEENIKRGFRTLTRCS